jgi:N-acetylmuramoyl-L-alanine amidase
MHVAKRSTLVVLFVGFCGVIFSAFGSSNMRTGILHNGASVFFAESAPIETLRTKYDTVTPETKSIRVLLVPGHEPDFGGTVYQDRFERIMTVELAQFLAAYLEKDSRFEVVQTRDTESWNPVLAEFFALHASDTDEFYVSKKTAMDSLAKQGLLQMVSSTPHNSAPADVARHLYGINQWANEQKIDLVVNIHFNDTKRKDIERPGPYTGFTVYVPERQYSNSSSSRVIADAITKRHKLFAATSDLAPESAGVVEDQDLISIGRYNTLDAPAVLIEYGYIYERQFDDPQVRSAVLKELAFETAVGIEDSFAVPSVQKVLPDSTYLPHTWDTELEESKKPSRDVLALQAALRLEGYYPAASTTLHTCPLSGYFDSCTAFALQKFQSAHQIANEEGFTGTSTRAILNRKYGKIPL